MKGAYEVPVDTLFNIILIVIGFAIVLGIIVSMMGGTPGLLAKVCESFPSLCADSTTNADIRTAQDSYNALHCALSVVMSGQDQTCVQDVNSKPKGTTGAFTALITGNTFYFSSKLADRITGMQTATVAKSTKFYGTDYLEQCLNSCQNKCRCNCKSTGDYKVVRGEPIVEYECDQVTKTPGSSIECSNIEKNYPDIEYHAQEASGENVVTFTFSGSRWGYSTSPPGANLGSSVVNVIPSILENPEIKNDYNKGLETIYDAVIKSDRDYMILKYTDNYEKKIEHADLGYIIDFSEKAKPLSFSSCTLYDFNLPQKVSSAKEWIAGYGDPQFLMYYQSMPSGEDASWRSFSSWKDNIYFIVISAIPAEAVFKTTKAVAVKGLEYAGEKIGTRTSAWLGKIAGKFKMASNKLSIFFVGEAATTAERKSVVNRYIAEMIEEDLRLPSAGNYKLAEEAFEKLSEPQKATFMNRLMGGKDYKLAWSDYKPLMKVAGVSTGAALLASYVDSVNNDFTVNPSQLVLDIPYNEQQKKIISNAGMPIVLWKDSLFSAISGTNYVPFYLASPCRADLKIDASEMVCGYYEFARSENKVTCTTPSNSRILAEVGLKNIQDCTDIPVALGLNPARGRELVKGILEMGKSVRLSNGETEIVTGTGSHTMTEIQDFYTGDELYYFNKVSKNLEKMRGCPDCNLEDPPSSICSSYKNEDDPVIGGEEAYVCRSLSFHIYMDPKNNYRPYALMKIIHPTADYILAIAVIDTDGDGYADVLKYVQFKELSGQNLPEEGSFKTVRAFSKDISIGTDCRARAAVVSVSKAAYEENPNFCFTTQAAGATTTIFIGTILADTTLTYFSAGTLAHVAVGLSGAVLETAASQVNNWPG